MRDHLDWLLNKISKSSEGLKQLQNTDKVTWIHILSATP
nr:hypothetical protein [Xenorhabdus bovienii]